MKCDDRDYIPLLILLTIFTLIMLMVFIFYNISKISVMTMQTRILQKMGYLGLNRDKNLNIVGIFLI